MKTVHWLRAGWTPLLALAWLLAFKAAGASATPADPGWPRQFKKDGKQLTIYQPQVDYWNGYTNIHFRAAIAVKTGSSKEEKFGVLEADANTVVDQAARLVAIIPTKRDIRFPNLSESDAKSLRKVVDDLRPLGTATTLALDRVLAYLNPEIQTTQRPVPINVEPPKLYYSRTPAVLVIFTGEPQFKPVQTNKTDLLFAVNTNWDVFLDTTSGTYYLLNGESWLSATDPVKGPWNPVANLPASISNLPSNENWSDVRKAIPGKPGKGAVTVLATTEPAELIVTDGEPAFSPVSGNRLLRVSNTDSTLFLNSADGKFYFLVAGRWFRASNLSGPWTSASNDLPADFAKIPSDSPAGYVKASVPGTEESKDAVLMASVPTTTTVSLTNATIQVTYQGAPKFETIQGTSVQYASNSPFTVFLVKGGYYCCSQGVWFCGGTANGPWTFCTSVPPEIYTIPPTDPHHNVTYVVVQSSTPSTVVYSQTSGYSGEYVAENGVLMFGMGMLLGAAIADNDCFHCYPSPHYYSYGCGARYSYGYGGYYSSAHVYGPYGGAGRGAAYNPYTGSYARGAYAYGPAGGASVRQAYNPYTGGYANASRVDSVYGSAGRFTAGRGDDWVTGGYRSGAYGSAAGYRTSEGTGMGAWDTARGEGAVAKDRQGNVYVGNDGNVYKKDSDGGWSSNNGSSWSRTSPSANSAAAQPGASSRVGQPASAGGQASSRAGQPAAASGQSTSWRSDTAARPEAGGSAATMSGLESQAQAREWGNQQSQRATQSRSAPASRSSGRRR